MALLHLISRVPQGVWMGGIAVLLLLWGLQPFQSRTVNPEVMPTFDQIVLDCQRETYPDHTPRCGTVLALRQACIANADKHACRLEGFYESMRRLGYVLPPLYLPDRRTAAN